MAFVQPQVKFHYLLDLPLYDTEKPFIFESNISYDKKPITNVEQDLFPVSLENIRGREQDFGLDRHGFAFIRHSSTVDFSETTQDTVAYILENSTILKEKFNADRVICYDVRRRSSEKNRRNVRAFQENTFSEPRMPAPPVYAVHVGRKVIEEKCAHNNDNEDHTRTGGFHRTRRHLRDDEIAEYIESGKWQIRVVNTWRPVKPIDASPLALCDAQTVDEKDLVPTDLVSEDYVGETYSFKYNPRHRFYWLKDQQPDELCVFVTFNSLDNRPGARITTCPHTSFDNPWAKPSSPPRDSIEVRSLVLNYLGESSDKS
ncbi:hypothetical protein F5Y16DRAFT_408459 [Xylariaceae sp. FL0255]|nr:hypothetical protein F5Y16DRAFT_408459 [Xylariaceae sp. FL0255]